MANNNMNPTPEQINMMLQLVGKKLNTDPAKLKAMIEKGDIGGITGSLGGPMGKKLGEVLDNPQQMKEMMGSADLPSILNQLKK